MPGLVPETREFSFSRQVPRPRRLFHDVSYQPADSGSDSKSETDLMNARQPCTRPTRPCTPTAWASSTTPRPNRSTTHLESCPDCRRRVAELSSDSFLGRLRDAQGRPDSPAPLISSTAGLSMLERRRGSPAPPPASTLPPGLADHPDYEILRELGRGGMGVVYLAQNTLMGRTEVLKVVSSHLINRRGVLDRFLAEIRNAARLHHPNIVTAYSALRLGESLVLAMEYVEGLDLARLVKARGPLPVAHACNYVHQAALGLQHAARARHGPPRHQAEQPDARPPGQPRDRSRCSTSGWPRSRARGPSTAA